MYALLNHSQNNFLLSCINLSNFEDIHVRYGLSCHNKNNSPSYITPVDIIYAYGPLIHTYSNILLHFACSCCIIQAYVPWNHILDIFFCIYFLFSFVGFNFSSYPSFFEFFFLFLFVFWLLLSQDRRCTHQASQ